MLGNRTLANHIIFVWGCEGGELPNEKRPLEDLDKKENDSNKQRAVGLRRGKEKSMHRWVGSEQKEKYGESSPGEGGGQRQARGKSSWWGKS